MSAGTREFDPRARLTAARVARYTTALYTPFLFFGAGVAELADALGSGPSGRKLVQVQVLSPAPFFAINT